MDSMIAYKNERYLHFGRVAAKLDDAVNFIPARLSGVCLIIAAFFLQLDYRGAAKVFMKDRLHHASPNAGHTEAATAGALGVRLGGPSVYFNKVVLKPYLGDTDCEPVPEDIEKTNRLVVVGSIIFFVLLAGVRLVVIR
jgi:adenosylcobinamide-phosphate synthase